MSTNGVADDLYQKKYAEVKMITVIYFALLLKHGGVCVPIKFL